MMSSTRDRLPWQNQVAIDGIWMRALCRFAGGQMADKYKEKLNALSDKFVLILNLKLCTA